jgi:hypothetical protein
MSTEPQSRAADLERLVAEIQRADCTIPRERAVAMVWTRRPDLKPASVQSATTSGVRPS